jgi:hypothetical protein
MISSRVLLSAIALAIAFAPSFGVSDEDRSDVTADAAVMGPAWDEQGAWQTRIQQVFDPASRTLSRRLYTIWDSEPSRDLDFVWTPDDPSADKPGRISGTGLLFWRIKSKPTYDQSSVFAEYRGAVRKGRIEGRGNYLDHTGLSYEGEWKAGLVDGQGSLKLPNGGEYVGQFRAGKANGTGRYIDVTGEIYEGPFVGGQRHGRGTTTLPNGHSYTSLWTNGKEGETSRLVRIAQAAGAIPPGSADDIRIGIIVENARNPPTRLPRFSAADLLYGVSNTLTGLAIRPEDKRLMSMWKGGGAIQLTQEEEEGGRKEGDSEYGVVSKSRAQIVPLKLVLEVQNRSSFSVNATGAYLDVRSSVTDMQPAIQLVVGAVGECNGPFYRPKFQLENFGWGAAEQAALRYDLTSPAVNRGTSSLPLSMNLGRIQRTLSVDLESSLRAGGVNVAVLSRNAKNGITCSAPKSLQICLQELKAAGTFGSLSEKVGLIDGMVVLNASGRLEYSWRDATGSVRQAASPFTASLPLTFLHGNLECGEGAGREAITTVAQQLRLDVSNYRIPLSFRASIPGGRTSQLTLPVKAEKSSEHDFTVVLQLSDGREIRSRAVNLLYYVPSWFHSADN